VRVTFWGAADTVTGSRFLVESGGARVLVDCGLFQGLKKLRLRNWDPFPVDPASIDAVVVTHAHIDHSGYLPALVRDGFRGPIWCTPGTADLSRILLLDSAHLHEEDARHLNKHRKSKHQPALPLYTTEDAEAALEQVRSQPLHHEFEVATGLRARFSSAGHIIGAACVHLDDGTRSIAFTGDVGRPNDPVMRAPEPPPAADHLVTESTYGNRVHPRTDPADELADVVNRTLERGGTVLLPAFAVGRTQTLLHLLAQLREAGRIPEVPTYVNSPMAVDATELFWDHPDDHRLTPEQCTEMGRGVTLVRSVEDSKALTPMDGPMIVLSASGMMSGGRVLHHLLTLAPNHRNTILITGYQAAGTRGQVLLAGERRLKIFGEYVPVRAEVASIESLSAHADADELTAWLSTVPERPSRVHVVHGEPAAADALRLRLTDELGWDVHVPDLGEACEVHGPR
jgi:metallo-beta-lactamase family protein